MSKGLCKRKKRGDRLPTSHLFKFALRLYTKNVPYIGMRMFAVACGVGLIPISYLTIKKSGHSTQAAMICAVLITFGKYEGKKRGTFSASEESSLKCKPNPFPPKKKIGF